MSLNKQSRPTIGQLGSGSVEFAEIAGRAGRAGSRRDRSRKTRILLVLGFVLSRTSVCTALPLNAIYLIRRRYRETIKTRPRVLGFNLCGRVICIPGNQRTEIASPLHNRPAMLAPSGRRVTTDNFTDLYWCSVTCKAQINTLFRLCY